MSKEYILVPKQDVEKLEQARKDLIAMLSDRHGMMPSNYLNITSAMHMITHKNNNKINVNED